MAQSGPRNELKPLRTKCYSQVKNMVKYVFQKNTSSRRFQTTFFFRACHGGGQLTCQLALPSSSVVARLGASVGARIRHPEVVTETAFETWRQYRSQISILRGSVVDRFRHLEVVSQTDFDTQRQQRRQISIFRDSSVDRFRYLEIVWQAEFHDWVGHGRTIWNLMLSGPVPGLCQGPKLQNSFRNE